MLFVLLCYENILQMDRNDDGTFNRKEIQFAQVCDAFILNGIAYCFEKGWDRWWSTDDQIDAILKYIVQSKKCLNISFYLLLHFVPLFYPSTLHHSHSITEYSQKISIIKHRITNVTNLGPKGGYFMHQRNATFWSKSFPMCRRLVS